MQTKLLHAACQRLHRRRLGVTAVDVSW